MVVFVDMAEVDWGVKVILVAARLVQGHISFRLLLLLVGRFIFAHFDVLLDPVLLIGFSNLVAVKTE